MIWLVLTGSSFILSVAMIVLSRTTTARRGDLMAVQAMHVKPTSRFGGLALLIPVAIAVVVGPTQTNAQMLQILACVLPVFLVSILEDGGLHVTPRWRLVAAATGSLAAVLLFGSVIDRLGFTALDLALNHHVLAVALTVLVVTGITQAFNLLDGLHGLCSISMIVVATALVVIAAKGDDVAFAQILSLLIAGLIGFLLLNYPFGLIFLGDTGATVIGFILAYTAVEMLSRQPDLSPWALMLVFFWPIADMVLAIARRLGRRNPTTQPDRMHFHHVVMRALEIRILHKKSRAFSNPATTAILMPLIAAPSAVGVLVWNRDDLSLAATLGFAVLFFTAYRVLVHSAKRRHGHARRPTFNAGRAVFRRRTLAK